MWPFISRLVKESCSNATSWLDLCCGTGALLEYVSKRGFSCVGIDKSPYQVEIAKHKVPDAKFHIEDVRNLSLSRRFDIITCTYDSLNYLTRKRDLERVFRKVRRHLAEYGLFIFDMNTFGGLQEKWCKTFVIHEPSKTLIIEASFDRTRRIGKCTITGFLGDDRLYRKFDETHIERGYYRMEIEQLLHKTGFSFKKYDGDTFKKPRVRSGRILYVCQRKRNLKQKGKK